MRRVAVLGCTGSVGRSTIEVIRAHNVAIYASHVSSAENGEKRCNGPFEVSLLVAGRQWKALAELIREFRPQVAGLADVASAELLCRELGISLVNPQFEGTRIAVGEGEICAAITESDAEIVIAAVVGMAGLGGVLAAVRSGKKVGLANKEALVVAGRLVVEEVARSGAVLVPVDSEHSAIFQCLQGSRQRDCASIVLTASGGPFLDTPLSELNSVSVEQALRHPRWSMGPKISIDSASMMNKALEVIEARWLFDVSADRIEVVVHPQSIVHSAVRFVDGSMLAQLSVPDMKGPIGYALSYPEGRIPEVMQHVNLIQIGQLTFRELDLQKFPAVATAKACLAAGGGACAVFNASNEVAVDAFLARQIPFGAITTIVAGAVERFAGSDYNTLSDLHELCGTVKEWAGKRMQTSNFV